MLKMYACAFVMAAICQTVIGQVEEQEWEPRNMPNPLRDFESCRLQRPGYLCDPDGVLSQRSVDLLDWLLHGFYDNDTACPCSTYWCERTHKGMQLSIAIVRKMKLADTFDHPDVAAMQAANYFAFQLQNQYWNFGSCENDAVIVYSLEDEVLFTSMGPTALSRLNSSTVEYIQSLYGHYFSGNGDRFTGFVEIILALRHVLSGNNIFDPTGPYALQLVGGASHVTSGILVTVTMTLLSFMWSLQ